MKVKLNFIERMLMKLSDLLFSMSRKIKQGVYKKYDKDNIYRSHLYYPDSGELIFEKLKKKIES